YFSLMAQSTLTAQQLFFRIMRSIWPIWKKGKQVWVFRDEDVREILTRDRDFTIRRVNQEKIERRIGPFLLSMDDGPTYQQEVGALRKAVKREDVAWVRRFVKDQSQEVLAQLTQTSHFEVVRGFMREIPLRLLGSYFGTPGPDDETMLKWNRILFQDIFLNVADKPEIIAEADAITPAFNTYITSCIQDIKDKIAQREPLPDTMLVRMIQHQSQEPAYLDDDGIRRNISGTLLGAEEPIAEACANILDELFRRPKVLAQVKRVAAEGDIKKMEQWVFETFRFQPNLPVIIRYAEKDCTLASGRKIPAGKIVYAFIASAMLDHRRFPAPSTFRLNRPQEDYSYFGMGLHQCFGKYINYVAIPEMLMALLKLPGLRPANGKEGKLIKEGPFPERWVLQWGS
ncbi:MAG: cytochrome P450, partial [Bacteroidota bacterium]